MKTIVIVAGVIAAIWYGTWEGLVEPSLPKHEFGQPDLEQLLFGAICAFVAFHLYVRDAGSTQEERVERLERASVFAIGNLAMAMSCVFMLPTVTNFEAVAYPYFELAADLTRLLPWRNQHDDSHGVRGVRAIGAHLDELVQGRICKRRIGDCSSIRGRFKGAVLGFDG